MIRPGARRCEITARVMRIVPWTLTAKILDISASENKGRVLQWKVPALLIRISILESGVGKAERVEVRILLGAFGSLRSARTMWVRAAVLRAEIAEATS